MTSKHTPGPWQVGGGIFGNNVILCQGSVDTCPKVPVWGELARVTLKFAQDSDGREWYSQGTSEANARLIAAAPDLLEAAQDIESKIVDFEAGRINWRPGDFLFRIRAAIAKATGDQS